MSGQIGITKDIEIIKKNQIRIVYLKSPITNKIFLERFNSLFEQAEERISKFENKLTDITQS